MISGFSCPSAAKALEGRTQSASATTTCFIRISLRPWRLIAPPQGGKFGVGDRVPGQRARLAAQVTFRARRQTPCSPCQPAPAARGAPESEPGTVVRRSAGGDGFRLLKGGRILGVPRSRPIDHPCRSMRSVGNVAEDPTRRFGSRARPLARADTGRRRILAGFARGGGRGPGRGGATACPRSRHHRHGAARSGRAGGRSGSLLQRAAPYRHVLRQG